MESAIVELELGDRRGPVTEEATNVIVQSFSERLPNSPRTSWLKHLVDVSDRIDHTVANGLLAALLEKETDWDDRTEIASTLVASAGAHGSDHAGSFPWRGPREGGGFQCHE